MFNSQNSHLELTAGINLELNKYTFWALQCGVFSLSSDWLLVRETGAGTRSDWPVALE